MLVRFSVRGPVSEGKGVGRALARLHVCCAARHRGALAAVDGGSPRPESQNSIGYLYSKTQILPPPSSLPPPKKTAEPAVGPGCAVASGANAKTLLAVSLVNVQDVKTPNTYCFKVTNANTAACGSAPASAACCAKALLPKTLNLRFGEFWC